LDLAEAFLQDGPYEGRIWSAQVLNAPDNIRILDSESAFICLAGWVNGYNRRGHNSDDPVGQTGWGPLLSAIENTSIYEHFCTQDLFDILFYYYRNDYWNGGGTLEPELPRLREIVREIVLRMRSDMPPTFVLKGPRQ
jgi:hypothetical protein